jgi:unsaturated rhamnogalacturonyl hydrolase
MITRHHVRETAALAAGHLLTYPWRIWFWGDSIGLEGLLDATELTGDGRYASFVHGLLKGWVAREQCRSSFDYTAPGVAMLRVWEKTGDEAILEAARRHGDYLAGFRTTTASAFMRYENAAIELPPELPPEHAEFRPNGGSPAEDGGPCVFVDCVHFDGPFFAKLFQVTGEERYRDLALGNILPQIELLYDPGQRLFHHFWIERTQRPNGVVWGRGNGWGLLGVVLTLEYLGTGAPEELRTLLGAALTRLAELQDASGAWHTVLDDPESYVESSTAAFYIDVIVRAIRLGVVAEKSFADLLNRAMRYIISHVDRRGVLEGVSFETFPSMRREHYRQMPRGAVVPWGQGPLLACLRSWAELTADDTAGRDPEIHATR